MAKLKAMNDPTEYAIDLLVAMTVEELSEELQRDPKDVLTDFVASKTGRLLYDESSGFWWNGPAYIADTYKQEKGISSKD